MSERVLNGKACEKAKEHVLCAAPGGWAAAIQYPAELFETAVEPFRRRLCRSDLSYTDTSMRLALHSEEVGALVR